MALKITLDPGHGQYGNKSPNNAKYIEGTQMWHLANKLKAVLESYGFEVVTTRPKLADDPSLSARGSAAGANGSCMFLSLHSNAPGANADGRYSPTVTGSVIYYSLTRAENKALADKLGTKVSALMGHNYRGSKTREYPGNAKVDYYGVIRAAAQSGCKCAMLIEHGFHTNVKDSNFLLVDSNLQKLAEAEAAIIADYFGQAKQPGAPVVPQPVTGEPDEVIWKFLKGKGLNDYAVAGVMGNLYAESALKPTNLQQTYEKKLGYTDATYTAAVDSSAYTNFVRDSAGYGLAQWTYWSRKQALLDFAKAAKASIGDMQTQLDFLWKELQGYSGVMKVLKTAKSVLEASNVVLLQYERPANQGLEVQTARAGYGQKYYDKFVGAPAQPAPETPVNELYRVRKTWKDGASQKGAYKVLANAKACADQNAGYSVFDSKGNIVYAPSAPAYKTYTVVKGDSLWKIASTQLGRGARWPEIKALNGLKSNVIYSGQVLKLPQR